MKFQIYIDKKGEYRWRLKAANGRILADSSEGYTTKQGVSRSLALVKHKIRYTAGGVRVEDLTK